MTLQQIHYALEVASMGSMNKAAEKLYISQPTLTSAIKELESETGIQIFQRTSRGVIVTTDGSEFLASARQLYQQYEWLMDQYGEERKIKQKFGISTQHYSFAVKAFVEMVKKYDTLNYEFAIRETKTAEVIEDVASGRSELGILFMSDYNKKILKKLLVENSLEFRPLIECAAYVYIWKGHPLASHSSISFEELQEYPCLSFEQGEKSSAYLAEEILTDRDYPRVIHANDRATMLNLMVGLNGYTLCSGIICEELNGSDYLAVPFEADRNNKNSAMNIGYITRRGSKLNSIGETYIQELQHYFEASSPVES